MTQTRTRLHDLRKAVNSASKTSELEKARATITELGWKLTKSPPHPRWVVIQEIETRGPGEVRGLTRRFESGDTIQKLIANLHERNKYEERKAAYATRKQRRS